MTSKQPSNPQGSDQSLREALIDIMLDEDKDPQYVTGWHLDVGKAADAILTLLTKEEARIRVEAVAELRRRWDEDRKTMDYSPDTYLFICDKYIKELQQEVE